MKINLTICGVQELADQEGQPWTHVISIWDRVSMDDLSCRKRIKAMAPGAELLFSFFDDVDDPKIPEAPSLRHVKRILAFSAKIPARNNVLVHCRAGVSRSTATAYAIFCQHTPAGMEMQNLLHAQSLRDLFMPNRLIIQLADTVLKRDGAMLLHLPRGS